MKHIAYLNGTEFTYDGELPCTHVVIGQRDIDSERPEVAEVLTPAEQVALAKFAHDCTAGRYSMRPLEWASDMEEAEKLAEHFRAMNCWLNVQIIPVNTVIENA